jgi:hypothetical protein
VRRAILTRLKADTPLIALVPAARILPQGAGGDKAWPFIRLGATVTQQLKAACVAGGMVALDIHAFARAKESGGQAVDTAEDHAADIGAEIERVLADNVLTLEGGEKAHISLSDISLMPDEEPESFHWFAQINARVLALPA